MRFLLFVSFFLFFSYPGFSTAHADPQNHRLIDALIQVESGGNDNAVGDKHLKRKAYGCLQIRQPCIDDINRRFGTVYTAEDCLGNRELSVWICERYLEIYAIKKRLGHEPTNEDRARVWNGGPSGWKKNSTLGYWKKIEKVLGS